jgi:hypothetical protein
MLADLPVLIVGLLFGFAGGYAVRELKSRERHRRWREKYWYGPPPNCARAASERTMTIPASQGALSTSHLNRNKPVPRHI